MKNLSAANPADIGAMAGGIRPDMTVAEYLGKMGIDVNGPVTQLIQFAQKQVQNANPLTKMRNIAADTALQPGGQPGPMPGPRPMVQPPGQPAPSGIEGLLSRLK
jgi:hypothetical protein